MQAGNYKTVLWQMMHCSSCIPETMREEAEDLCKFLKSCLRMEFLLECSFVVDQFSRTRVGG